MNEPTSLDRSVRMLTVSEVRSLLYQSVPAEERAGFGTASNARLGSWFHEWLGLLVSADPAINPLSAMDEVDGDDALKVQAVCDRAYQTFVGPRLTEYQAELRCAPTEVLGFHRAVREAATWIVNLALASARGRPRARREPASPWVSWASYFESEVELACELRDPAWTAPVQLRGVADAVVYLPLSGRWCAIEFKSGQTSPLIDLGQACLYHLLLSQGASRRGDHPAEGIEAAGAGAGGAAQEGHLALVTFSPERREQLFSPDDLAPARARLMELIGRAAGVYRLSQEPAGPVVSDSRPTGGEAARGPATPPLAIGVPDEADLQLGRALVRELRHYDVMATFDEAAVKAGPSFVRYPLSLARGSTIAKLKKCTTEVQLRLRLKSAPVVTNEQGELYVDLVRPVRQTVWFSMVRDALRAARIDPQVGGALLPVGVNLHAQVEFANLSQSENCHLLVTGTTGSGKSEWLRQAVAGLLVSNTVDTLRLVLIDPKRVTFGPLRHLPHLWKPVVYGDNESPLDVLGELVEEIERRYLLLEQYCVDSRDELVRRHGLTVPRMVLFCDEYGDFLQANPREAKELERLVGRLGAKARAAAIHLVLATQEASRKTLSGPIKANLPGRLSLKVISAIESKMVLEQAGAEQLLDRGDLLFRTASGVKRLQSALMTEQDRAELFPVPRGT